MDREDKNYIDAGLLSKEESLNEDKNNYKVKVTRTVFRNKPVNKDYGTFDIQAKNKYLAGKKALYQALQKDFDFDYKEFNTNKYEQALDEFKLDFINDDFKESLAEDSQKPEKFYNIIEEDNTMREKKELLLKLLKESNSEMSEEEIKSKVDDLMNKYPNAYIPEIDAKTGLPILPDTLFGDWTYNKNLEEDIEKHDTLNPKLFDESGKLKPEVKEKVLEIVKEFTNGLKEDGIKINVKDIKLVGSNVSYNYTKDSDLDVHIVADTDSLECPENLYPLLYSAYRSLWNNKMNIDFYGIPVELYVETSDTEDLNTDTPIVESNELKTFDDFIKSAEVLIVDDAHEFDINKWEEEYQKDLEEEADIEPKKDEPKKEEKFIKYKLDNNNLDKVIAKLQKCSPSIVDGKTSWKTRQFLKKRNLELSDLKTVLNALTSEDYKQNSKPINTNEGYNEAIIFIKETSINNLGPFKLYIKLDYDSIEQTPVIIISIHES